MVGTIIDAEIRFNYFNVIFIDDRVKDENFMSHENYIFSLKDDIIYPIQIKDLKPVKDDHCSDEGVLESILNHNKIWWCKLRWVYS